jgi:hypothetical protein
MRKDTTCSGPKVSREGRLQAGSKKDVPRCFSIARRLDVRRSGVATGDNDWTVEKEAGTIRSLYCPMFFCKQQSFQKKYRRLVLRWTFL